MYIKDKSVNEPEVNIDKKMRGEYYIVCVTFH